MPSATLKRMRHAIGADRGDIVHLHGGDVAGLLHGDAGLDAMVARLGIGDEGFEPVDAELDRPAQKHAGHHGRHLVGVEVELHAEAAADIGRDHPHLVFGDLQVAAEHVLHLERGLVGVDDGERAVAGIEIRDQAARFQRHRHLPFEAQLRLEDEIGLGKCLGGLAAFQREIEGDVVAELRVDDGGARRERRNLVGDDGQRLPFDGHELGRILRFGAAVGDDRDRPADPARPRAPLPADACGADRCPGRCSATPTNGSHLGLMSAAVKTAATPGACFAAAVSIDETCMGMGAADEADVQHARQLDVVDEAAMAAEQALELPPRMRAPMPPALPGRLRTGLHQRCSPAVLALMTASTASTMAW